MAVFVRTHGGLGNQLFQIFYARLLAVDRAQNYTEIHDANYAHAFPRSRELRAASVSANWWQKSISAVRVPKILRTLGFSTSGKFSFVGHCFLDGYFQFAEDYEEFSELAVKEELDSLRHELGINVAAAPIGPAVYHIRLGDFFNDTDSAIAHANERVQALSDGSSIITNQEEIFEEASIARTLNEKGCRILSTQGFSAEEVLRLMVQFEEIISNDSTLAFWASVLGGRKATFESQRLNLLHAAISKCVR